MKFSILALSSLLALVAAQDSTGSAYSTPTLSPEAACATKCAAGDVCCRARCYKVPCPNDTMANDTTACAAACPQGSGTPSDTAKYAKCQQDCFSSLFFPATVDGPTATDSNGKATGTAGSATGTGATFVANATGKSKLESTSGSNSKSGTSTATGTASVSTNAANQMQLGVSAAGLLGAVVVAIAL